MVFREKEILGPAEQSEGCFLNDVQEDGKCSSF